MLLPLLLCAPAGSSMYCALLALGKRTEAAVQVIEQVDYIAQYLMEIISRLVPGFIFIVLVQMVWSGTLSVVLSARKPFGLCGAGPCPRGEDDPLGGGLRRSKSRFLRRDCLRASYPFPDHRIFCCGLWPLHHHLREKAKHTEYHHSSQKS